MAAAIPVTPIPFTKSVVCLPAGNISGAAINRGRPDAQENDWTGLEINNIWQTVATGPGTIHSFNAAIGGAATYVSAWRVDGVVYIADEVTPNAVTAIGANSLTVDGGSWTVGNTVTGPTLAAATGAVASTSGSEMTLSASDGRWISNAGKFISKSAAYDVALTFTDDSELENIIGPATQVNADGSDYDSVETSPITAVTPSAHKW